MGHENCLFKENDLSMHVLQLQKREMINNRPREVNRSFYQTPSLQFMPTRRDRIDKEQSHGHVPHKVLEECHRKDRLSWAVKISIGT
jgi:hypothetical protein